MSLEWLLVCLLVAAGTWAQEPVTDVRSVGMDELAKAAVLDLESQQIRLEYYQRHPVDLNRATGDELAELGLLSAGQIASWLQFRRMFGPATDWHVFQAVPGWTESTVIFLRSYSFLSKPSSTFRELVKAPGRHWFLSRLNWSERRIIPSTAMGGSMQALFRYQYYGTQGLQVGLTMEKDAGERSWQKGPDFWSVHVKWIGRRGVSWLVGDYTIQLGQGLACWQSMVFGAGSELTAIKQQALPVRPYQSVGESRFMRGIAVGKVVGRWQWSTFLSLNPQSATLYDWNGVGKVFLQVDASGLHRTLGERAKKNSLNEYTIGGRFGRQDLRGRFFFNLAARRWSLPRVMEEGRVFLERARLNATVDLAVTRGPLHAFGEWAIDGEGKVAALSGMVLTMGRKMDLAVHLRLVGAGYRSVDGQIFQQAARVDAERGVYAQVRWRLSSSTTLDAFSDIFCLPRAGDADLFLTGTISGLRLEYRPDKKTVLYARLQSSRQEKEGRATISGAYSHRFRSLRVHGQFPLTPKFSMAVRTEQVWVRGQGSGCESGFLSYAELRYEPSSSGWGIDFRCMWVSSDGWDSRVYVYERDVLYKTGFPAFSGNLARAYLNSTIPLGPGATGWIRYELSKVFVNQLLNHSHPTVSDGLTLQVRLVLGDARR